MPSQETLMAVGSRIVAPALRSTVRSVRTTGSWLALCRAAKPSASATTHRCRYHSERVHGRMRLAHRGEQDLIRAATWVSEPNRWPAGAIWLLSRSIYSLVRPMKRSTRCPSHGFRRLSVAVPDSLREHPNQPRVTNEHREVSLSEADPVYYHYRQPCSPIIEHRGHCS